LIKYPRIIRGRSTVKSISFIFIIIRQYNSIACCNGGIQ